MDRRSPDKVAAEEMEGTAFPLLVGQSQRISGGGQAHSASNGQS